MTKNIANQEVEAWKEKQQSSGEILSYIKAILQEIEELATSKNIDIDLELGGARQQIEGVEQRIKEFRKIEESRVKEVLYDWNKCLYFTPKHRDSLFGQFWYQEGKGRVRLTPTTLLLQTKKSSVKISVDVITKVQVKNSTLWWGGIGDKYVEISYQDSSSICLRPLDPFNVSWNTSSVTRLSEILDTAMKNYQNNCKLRLQFWKSVTIELQYTKKKIDALNRKLIGEEDTNTSSRQNSTLLVPPNDRVSFDESTLGIPTHLYNRLRQVLLNCIQFKNQRELKALFADQRLSLWRGQVPDSESTEGRVNLLIDFLVNRYNANGENGLILFLQVLADQLDPHDALYHELLDLANELEKIMGKDKHIQQ